MLTTHPSTPSTNPILHLKTPLKTQVPRADARSTIGPCGVITEGNAIMAKLSTDDLLDAFKEMTLIELSEFVKLFEDTFEVTAAAPVAMAAVAPAAAGAGDAGDAAEQDEFDVVLE